MTFHGAERSVELIDFVGGHTESDTVLLLPQEGIVFMSDLLFIDHQPYLGGGDPDRMLEILEAVSDLAPKLLVPGHGPVGTADSLTLMGQYVRSLDGLARQMVEDGQAEEEIDALAVPDPWSIGSSQRSSPSIYISCISAGASARPMSRSEPGSPPLAVYLGSALLWPSYHTLASLLLCVILSHQMAKIEEEHLLARHGDAYLRYCKRVPRYIGIPTKGQIAATQHGRPPIRGRRWHRVVPMVEWNLASENLALGIAIHTRFTMHWAIGCRRSSCNGRWSSPTRLRVRPVGAHDPTRRHIWLNPHDWRSSHDRSCRQQ